jgi:hypothetical protein
MKQGPEQTPSPSAEALAAGYEPSDVRLSGLLWFLVGMIVVGAALYVGVWFLQKEFLRQSRLVDVPRSAVADQQAPPDPQIQPSVSHDTLPFQDLELMRSQEDAVFQKLGWNVNAETHAVSIPATVLDRVQKAEASLGNGGARSKPTAGPDNANSIHPGPPTTQTTDGAAFSPQGPAPGPRGDVSDKQTTQGSGGFEHGPRPERAK